MVVRLGRQVNCALLSEDLTTVLMTCEIQIAHQNLLVTRSGLPGELCARRNKTQPNAPLSLVHALVLL